MSRCGGFLLSRPIGARLMAALAVLLITAEVRAAEPATSGSKPSAVEQSPEQAAGGKENLKRMKSACETDASRHCKGVMPGGGRIIRCLREHEAELGAECRLALPPAGSKP